MSYSPHLPFSLGSHKDRTDPRDYRVRVVRPAALDVPRQLDYSPQLSPIRNQGRLGSCVSFAACKVKEWQEARQRRRAPFDLSEAFLYELIRLPGGGSYPRVAMDRVV